MSEDLSSLTQRVQNRVGTLEDGKWGPNTAKAVLTRLDGLPGLAIARHINDRGLTLVKHFEGCQLHAYLDEAGVPTIGYGHTGLQHQDGTVYVGRTVTQQEAEDLLAYDMNQFEARVISLVKVPLTDDQFSALVAFDFNTGGLAESTLLRVLNQSNYPDAADQLLRWDKARVKGELVVLRGLTRRRQSERNLFLGKTPYIVDVVA